MYSDIQNIIYKYHQQLLMKDVFQELKIKYKKFINNCHFCDVNELSIIKSPCISCNIYICKNCQYIYPFHKNICDFCKGINQQQFIKDVLISFFLLLLLLFIFYLN